MRTFHSIALVLALAGCGTSKFGVTGGIGEGGEGEGEGEGEGDCGDGTCNSDEDCGTCATDCGCGDGQVCSGGGECLAPPPAGAPAVFFSDIDSGPKTGWQGSGDRGAAVTIWGRNFGGERGDSFVTIGGIDLTSEDDYLSWGIVGPPPELTNLTFLVPAAAPDGEVDVTVTVGGDTSLPISFTVRPGGIHYVMANGTEGGDGTWANPWVSLQRGIGRMEPGDITYAGDGVDATAPFDFGASIDLTSSGEPGRPMAIVGLPGATVSIGRLGLDRGAIHNWNPENKTYTKYWTIAGMEVMGAFTCMPGDDGYRIVGNRITAPEGDGASGCVEMIGSHLRVYGNEFYDVGRDDGSKLYHALYITGVRRMNGERAPTETDRDVGWNYFHDNRNDRAINIYSEQDAAAFISGHRIHDNWIFDQRGDGILMGSFVVGENWIYNNVIVRAGLGPDWNDDSSSHAGIRLTVGHRDAPGTVVHVWNNTVVDCGWGGGGLSGQSGNLLIESQVLDRATVDLRNNVFSSSTEPQVADETPDLPAGSYGNLWFGGSAPRWDSDAITTDPGFLGADDFRLGAGSPAIDAGQAGDFVTTDLDGVARPQGAGWDMGAYEFAD
jgi:hypothetical protein